MTRAQKSSAVEKLAVSFDDLVHLRQDMMNLNGKQEVIDRLDNVCGELENIIYLLLEKR